ncbi:hypothetical protein M3O44_01955 [Xanthomonas nasturtii]|uniref:hypothetical protein n=1 Tax=Xanthomonas nasturtii TaxID=1843581 RepID=UPI0020123D50|nr:hypothetical protein [Xanthomonas nasturtii]MCL1521488.1 hypothetical protein [Xanthomonas nasturtii]
MSAVRLIVAEPSLQLRMHGSAGLNADAVHAVRRAFAATYVRLPSAQSRIDVSGRIGHATAHGSARTRQSYKIRQGTA